MADELKQPMIKLVANVVHAKDRVVALAGLFRDLHGNEKADGHDIEDVAKKLDAAVDELRAAKKAAGL